MPAAATSRVRELSRGGRRKNDQIDAAAAATVAYLQGDGRDVVPEDHTTALTLLDERRVNLAQTRVRTVNQLHALLPGDAPTQLSADLGRQAAAIRPPRWRRRERPQGHRVGFGRRDPEAGQAAHGQCCPDAEPGGDIG
ncbi:transposase [Streptomyces sp. NPDC057239]|uniref:IS110 family transposase n=1 Tax=Streptomyces sp. NPDC057239 TaxID=3346061 RepID=UPI0036358988